LIFISLLRINMFKRKSSASWATVNENPAFQLRTFRGEISNIPFEVTKLFINLEHFIRNCEQFIQNYKHFIYNYEYFIQNYEHFIQNYDISFKITNL